MRSARCCTIRAACVPAAAGISPTSSRSGGAATISSSGMGRCVLDAVARCEIVEPHDLHQLVGDGVRAGSQAAGFIDRGRESRCARRQASCGRSRARSCATSASPCRLAADQCSDPANLREAVRHGERDVEQFVANAHSPQCVARRDRGVTAGQHEVGSQRDDFLCSLVRDRQTAARAQRSASAAGHANSG